MAFPAFPVARVRVGDVQAAGDDALKLVGRHHHVGDQRVEVHVREAAGEREIRGAAGGEVEPQIEPHPPPVKITGQVGDDGGITLPVDGAADLREIEAPVMERPAGKLERHVRRVGLAAHGHMAVPPRPGRPEDRERRNNPRDVRADDVAHAQGVHAGLRIGQVDPETVEVERDRFGSGPFVGVGDEHVGGDEQAVRELEVRVHRVKMLAPKNEIRQLHPRLYTQCPGVGEAPLHFRLDLRRGGELEQVEHLVGASAKQRPQRRRIDAADQMDTGTI